MFFFTERSSGWAPKGHTARFSAFQSEEQPSEAGLWGEHQPHLPPCLLLGAHHFPHIRAGGSGHAPCLDVPFIPRMPQGLTQSPGRLNWGLGIVSLKNLGIQSQELTGGWAVGLAAQGFLGEETAGLGDLGHLLGTLLHIPGCGLIGPAWLCLKNMAKACCQVSVPWRLPGSVTSSPRPFLKLLGLDLRQLARRWKTQPGPLPLLSAVLPLLPLCAPLPHPGRPHRQTASCASLCGLASSVVNFSGEEFCLWLSGRGRFSYLSSLGTNLKALMSFLL